MSSISCALCSIVILGCCSVTNAAVKPMERPSMAVLVESGNYKVRGKNVNVASTVELKVEARDTVRVKAEELVLGDGAAQGWGGGSSLKKVLGPVDTGTRLPHALDAGSVVVYSGDTIFAADKDYKLDPVWGGISRLDEGTIAKNEKVMVDYTVYLQRIDTVQVSSSGVASIKKGTPAAVCAAVPQPDPGYRALANIYVGYETAAIAADDICPVPDSNIEWRSYIKTAGRENLKNTLGLLKAGQPVTVVCWGDSVTVGGSSSSPQKCYVELFRSRLTAAYPKSNIKLINAGIGGSSTNSRRDGFDKEVLSYNPDLITVEFVNDIGLGPDMIRKNWAEFIARARKKNPNVEFILITPHNIMREWMANFPVGADAMRQAAMENRVGLADANNVWMNLSKVGIPYYSLLANGINHPNDLGHEIFASCIMQLLQPEK